MSKSRQRYKKRKKQMKQAAVKTPAAFLFLGMFKLIPSVFNDENSWRL